MGAMTNFLENKLLDFLLRGQALGITGATAGAGTGPANLYIGLFTVAPSEAGGGTEVTGGSYARVSVASTLANWAGTQSAGSTVASSGTGGTSSNNNAITFPAPTANWGSVVAVGIFDAVSGGNLLWQNTLSQAKTVNNGDAAPSFPAAALAVQIDD